MGRGDPSPAVYFLSDYGLADEFVGIVHAVLHVRAPGVQVVDLGHQVPPWDIRAGADLLVRCAPFLGAGVVLAVVDPGVGTDRRGVAVETVGAGPSWLVGPDNGLLVPAAEAWGGVRRVIALRSPSPGDWRPADRRSRTFDGRDLFAPAAAHLVLGDPPADLGPEVDPASLVPAGAGPGPSSPTGPHPTGGRAADEGPLAGVETAVSSLDRFGNVQLGNGPELLDRIGMHRGDGLLVTPPGHPRRSLSGRWVGTFGELDAGELGLLIDSSGRLALVCDRASAADRLAPVAVGDLVRITPTGRPNPPE